MVEKYALVIFTVTFGQNTLKDCKFLVFWGSSHQPKLVQVYFGFLGRSNFWLYLIKKNTFFGLGSTAAIGLEWNAENKIDFGDVSTYVLII